MKKRDSIPRDDLPLLPPVEDVETRSTLKLAVVANRELALLKGYCATLPSARILVNSLVLQEAKSSSEIENIITTSDELYKALVVSGKQATPEAKEVIDYRAAVWRGYELLRKRGGLTINMMIEIQKTIVKNDAGIRSLPGTALQNDATGEIIYTPPAGRENIIRLLGNLEQYLNATAAKTDPLIAMAVAHYQFEAIHPFYDGNGRTGRILNVLYLIHRGLIDLPVLYLSRSIIEKKARYHTLLREVGETGQWEEWVLFVLEAVRDTSVATLKLVSDIRTLMDRTIEECRTRLPKGSYSKELVELLFVQPYIKIDHLTKAEIAQRRTASKYLKELEQIGTLQSFKAWKETIYINTRLYEMLKE